MFGCKTKTFQHIRGLPTSTLRIIIQVTGWSRNVSGQPWIAANNCIQAFPVELKQCMDLQFLNWDAPAIS